LKLAAPKKVRLGDSLAFFRPQTGEVLVEADVVLIENDIITLSKPVPGLNIAPPGTTFDRQGWRIYDHAYNQSATGNYFVYRNNYMHDGRRFGCNIKASYGLIENNRFERLSDCVLSIQNEPGWPEGFWSRNLVIRNNRMLDCAFIKGRAPVSIDWHKLEHASAGVPVQENIFFEGNTVRALSGPAAVFNCINGLTLKNNVFESGSKTGPLVTGKNTKVRQMENNIGQDRFEFEKNHSQKND
jgi:hypothetical protein